MKDFDLCLINRSVHSCSKIYTGVGRKGRNRKYREKRYVYIKYKFLFTNGTRGLYGVLGLRMSVVRKTSLIRGG